MDELNRCEAEIENDQAALEQEKQQFKFEAHRLNI